MAKGEGPVIPMGGGIPGAPEPLPDTMDYDPATKRLTIGKGFIDNVPKAVWDYEVSGKNVLRQWFSYRKLDRSRPIIGDRRQPSPLDKIQPEHWPDEYTRDLMDLLHVLGRLVALEPAQADLLERVLAAPLIPAAGLAPPRREIPPSPPGEKVPEGPDEGFLVRRRNGNPHRLTHVRHFSPRGEEEAGPGCAFHPVARNCLGASPVPGFGCGTDLLGLASEFDSLQRPAADHEPAYARSLRPHARAGRPFRAPSAPAKAVKVDPVAVRLRLEAMLTELKAAEARSPWTADTTRLNQLIFPQMANWLPEEERAQLRLAFESELKRLNIAA